MANSPPNTESDPQPLVSTIFLEYGRQNRKIRSQSQPVLRQSNQLSQDQDLQTLHNAPAGPPQSLNKYKVLPSIEGKRSEHSPGAHLDRELSSLKLTDGPFLKESQRQGAGEDRKVEPSDTGLTTEHTSSDSLLLAIREPTGKRFQQHFHSTDTLLKVRASAEAKYGVKYGEASIETMEVPRRTFTDMNMTLGQCGILNRSVLCIFQHESAVDG